MKWLLRWIEILAWIAFAFACVVSAVWVTGALYFDLPVPYAARVVIAIAWVIACAGAVTVWRRRQGHHWWAMGVLALISACVLGWWLTLQPRQDRDWKPEVALLPYATVGTDAEPNAGAAARPGGSGEGEVATIYNVRNFDYRTENDFTPRYETRRYHLARLRGLDAFQTYWGVPIMAHPIMSFDFGEEGRIAFSIEARYEKGETYSPIGGLYRRYELIAVAADERDVVRVRTNIRPGEDVYLYRLNVVPATARQRFKEYLATINELKAKPEWYNAVAHNCTTIIRTQMDANVRPAWDWRILVNGYADEMLYDQHGLVTGGLPFAELKKRAYINPRAKAAGDSPDFSEQIRTHLPPMPPESPEETKLEGDKSK